MTYRFITTFSDKQAKVYGDEMVESFQASIEGAGLPVELVVVSDEDIKEDGRFRAYWDRWNKKPFAHGVVADKSGEKKVVDYRLQALRFAWKVFAYTNPKYFADLTKDDWYIWIDADTIFTGPMTQEWLHSVCPGGFMGSYIGRKDWDHSECGWMAYSMRYHAEEFLLNMRLFYTSDLMFGLPQWHDSYVWDRVRQIMELKHGSRWFNLADGISGSHPWPETRLGEIIEHHKGPQAKVERYGEFA